MTAEREKALEEWLPLTVWNTTKSQAFRAGYDAREPEIERLRAELRRADQIARDAMSVKTARAESAESALATARERIAELEAKNTELRTALEALHSDYATSLQLEQGLHERAQAAESEAAALRAEVAELETVVLERTADAAAAIARAELAEGNGVKP